MKRGTERESFKNFPGKRKSGESERKKKTRNNRWGGVGFGLMTG